MFQAARAKHLTDDQVIAYSDSLAKLRDTQAGIAYAAEKSRAEGRAEGLEAGRAEGLEAGQLKERNHSIRLMLSFGIAPEKIAGEYGISTEDVERIGNPAV